MDWLCIALCSDEFGGEHAPILIPAAELDELAALGYRKVYDADHYQDGIETWQGPVRGMSTAYKRWRGKQQ